MNHVEAYRTQESPSDRSSDLVFEAKRLTTEANAEVSPIYPQAMSAILTEVN
jgi:hypothetical protein